MNTLQSETNEHMKDLYKTRVWAIRPRCIDDIMFSDTFFSSVYSIRGFKFFFKRSKYEKVALMRWDSQAPEAYENLIRYVVAPNKTVTDNTQVLTGTRWTSINRRYCILAGLTVPLRQHQSYCEMTSDKLKFSLCKLFHNTPHVPIKYWFYAASFLDRVRHYLSRSSLDGRSGLEQIKGDTSDIIIFRFRWFESF